MSTTSIPFELPKIFLGIFKHKHDIYGPLLYDALHKIRSMSIPEDLRPFFTYQVYENPRPSFILLNFSYLAAAEATGGITQRHIDFLPTLMLFAELLAVADDTVDRTPQRSDRFTFAHQFGDESSLPFAAALTSMILTMAESHGSQLFDTTSNYFVNFFPLELWERKNVFPTEALFDKWLEHRYAQSSNTNEYVINCALIINGNPLISKHATAALGRIAQDVDDIVNLVEYREQEGENDDLRMGIVTRPLAFAVKENPDLYKKVAELWSYYRPIALSRPSITDLQIRYRELHYKTHDLYQNIRRDIITYGVPNTIKACLSDLRLSSHESPQQLRPMMRKLASAFMDRLRRLAVN